MGTTVETVNKALEILQTYENRYKKPAAAIWLPSRNFDSYRVVFIKHGREGYMLSVGPVLLPFYSDIKRLNDMADLGKDGIYKLAPALEPIVKLPHGKGFKTLPYVSVFEGRDIQDGIEASFEIPFPVAREIWDDNREKLFSIADTVFLYNEFNTQLPPNIIKTLGNKWYTSYVLHQNNISNILGGKWYVSTTNMSDEYAYCSIAPLREHPFFDIYVSDNTNQIRRSISTERVSPRVIFNNHQLPIIFGVIAPYIVSANEIANSTGFFSYTYLDAINDALGWLYQSKKLIYYMLDRGSIYFDSLTNIDPVLEDNLYAFVSNQPEFVQPINIPQYLSMLETPKFTTGIINDYDEEKIILLLSLAFFTDRSMMVRGLTLATLFKNGVSLSDIDKWEQKIRNTTIVDNLLGDEYHDAVYESHYMQTTGYYMMLGLMHDMFKVPLFPSEYASVAIQAAVDAIKQKISYSNTPGVMLWGLIMTTYPDAEQYLKRMGVLPDTAQYFISSVDKFAVQTSTPVSDNITKKIYDIVYYNVSQVLDKKDYNYDNDHSSNKNLNR